MRRFTIQSAITGLLLLLNHTVQASEGSVTDFNLTEVAAGVFVHTGVHVSFDDPQHDDVANIGFVVGDDCVAVIDTGGSVRVAQNLLRSIRQNTDKPVCYVINTHVHFDHVLGNVIFRSDQTQFVGHADLADAIAANREFFIEEFGADLGEFANSDGIVPPGLLVGDTLELDLGNRLLTLKAWPTAHSHTDLTVLDNTTNTIWLSDLLFTQRIPALDGKLKGWLAVMEQLRQETYTTIIPGHGAVSNNWPAVLDAQTRYLNMLLNQTRSRITEGAFMEDVIETVGKEEKLNWLLHEQHHGRNVSKAFTELEWE